MAPFWLLLLLPGGPTERRAPPGRLDAQAVRLLLALLRLRATG